MLRAEFKGQAALQMPLAADQGREGGQEAAVLG